jgi:hypothetical protein
MKYMFLIYSNPAKQPAPGTAEFGKQLAAYGAAAQTYMAEKAMVNGEALQAPSTATTVRVRGGKTQVLDGPFAETKEMLGGYYILDCADLDAAIRYATLIPNVHEGAIEIRPVIDLGKFS